MKGKSTDKAHSQTLEETAMLATSSLVSSMAKAGWITRTQAATKENGWITEGMEKESMSLGKGTSTKANSKVINITERGESTTKAQNRSRSRKVGLQTLQKTGGK